MRVVRVIKKKIFAATLAVLALTTLFYLFTDSSNSSNDLSQIVNVEKINLKDAVKRSLIDFIPVAERQLITGSYKNDTLYMLPVNQARLNTLFKLIQSKESSYHPILKKLNLISFSDLLITNTGNQFNLEKLEDKVYSEFPSEINTYFRNDNGQLVGNEKFIEELNILSYYYSFLHKRSAVIPSPIKDVRKFQSN